MKVVQTMHIFSLVSSLQYACVCVMTISCKLYQKVQNNSMCDRSISNGECGGFTYFSVYESRTVALPDAQFGGFCLTQYS